MRTDLVEAISQAAAASSACWRVKKLYRLRNSSRALPSNDSTCQFWVGLPASMKVEGDVAIGGRVASTIVV